jgi:hypothetical protein
MKKQSKKPSAKKSSSTKKGHSTAGASRRKMSTTPGTKAAKRAKKRGTISERMVVTGRSASAAHSRLNGHSTPSAHAGGTTSRPSSKGTAHNIDHARVGLLETKVRALATQLDEARRLAAEYESRLKSNRSTNKEQNPMSTSKRTMFFVALANLARAGADALDELTSGLPTHLPPATVGAAPAVEAPAPKPAAAPKPAKVAKAEPTPVAVEKAAAAPTNGAAAGDLMAQTRAAAKAYAEVYGREGLVAVLKQFTTGTLADVSPEKLPEVIKALS